MLKAVISSSAVIRLRSALAGAVFGFGISVLANQVSPIFGLLAIALGIAIWLYDSWSFRGIPGKLMASLGSFVVLALAIVVVPVIIPWPWGVATLYYDDKALDGATIILAQNDPDPKCSRMHIWPDKRGVQLCRIWIDKPAAANQLGEKYVEYVELSESVGTIPGGCSVSEEPPKPPYKSSLICAGSKPTLHRLYLPVVNAATLKHQMQIRISVEYDKSRVAVAAFTVRPQ